MKTRIIALLIFSFIIGITHAQNINQFDSNGEKHGKWEVYLDENWKEVDEKSEAVYYRYTYYDHGFNIYPMGPCGKKGWKVEYNKVDKSDDLILLDGEYRWIDNKGRTSSVHQLKNGEYLSCKEYDSDQRIKQHFEYSKKYKKQQHNYYVYIFDNGKKVKDKVYVMRNGKKGWMLYFEGSLDDL